MHVAETKVRCAWKLPRTKRAVVEPPPPQQQNLTRTKPLCGDLGALKDQDRSTLDAPRFTCPMPGQDALGSCQGQVGARSSCFIQHGRARQEQRNPFRPSVRKPTWLDPWSVIGLAGSTYVPPEVVREFPTVYQDVYTRETRPYDHISLHLQGGLE